LLHLIIAVVQYVGSDRLGPETTTGRSIRCLWPTWTRTAPPSIPPALTATAQGVAGQLPNPSGKGNLPALNANIYRNYPGFSNINQEENETNFDYHSLQAGVRLENRHGLTTQVAYTWAHNISEVSNDLNGLSNPYNAEVRPRLGRLRSTGVTILNVSYVYALPWFAKSSTTSLAHEVLGGWSGLRRNGGGKRSASVRHLHRPRRCRP
jgi:hypothetical protein